MGSMGRLIGGLFGFTLLCVACGGTSTHSPNDTISCTPGTQRCDGHQIKRCDDSGAGESVWQSCLSAECRMQDGVASCAELACTPNLGVCDGTSATTCKADGSGPLAGGVDCAETGQYCIDGECKETLCKAGTNSCKDGDLYRCAADGRSLSLLEACAASEVCNDALGKCLARICEPNKTGCFGNRVATCDAFGAGWLPETADCAAQDQICVDGSCQVPGCTPSASFCWGGDIYQCDPQGVRGTLSKECRTGAEHCAETAAGMYAFCVKNDCPVGQNVCDGNTVKLCNGDGTLPDNGTPCKDDEYCVDAQCKPRDCTVGVAFCRENAVYECAVDGPSLVQRCDALALCQVIAAVEAGTKANPDLATCTPVPCRPGSAGCVQNKIGSCNSEGTSLSGETTDCAASGQVCTLDATCAPSATDTIGSDDNTASVKGSVFVGNVIDVASARTLTTLQVWLSIPAASDLHWMVFEQSGTQFVSKVDQTSAAARGTGFASSGPFDFQLEAGKRYALGVVIPEEIVPSMTMESPLLGESTSFGPVIGTTVGPLDFEQPADCFQLLRLRRLLHAADERTANALSANQRAACCALRARFSSYISASALTNKASMLSGREES